MCLQSLFQRISDSLKIQQNIWKVIAACNVSTNATLSQVLFLSYFKNKYFLEHLPALASGNVTECVVLHQYNQ